MKMNDEIEQIKIKKDLDKWGVKIVNKESFLKHRTNVKDNNTIAFIFLFAVVVLIGVAVFVTYKFHQLETSDIQEFYDLCQEENIHHLLLDMDGDYMECVNGRLTWVTDLEDGS